MQEHMYGRGGGGSDVGMGDNKNNGEDCDSSNVASLLHNIAREEKKNRMK